MPKSTFKPRAKAKAIALVRDKGYSYAQAAAEVGAVRDTVKRWCDQAEVRSGAADARTDAGPAPRGEKFRRTVEAAGPLEVGVLASSAPPEREPESDDSLESVLRDMQRQLKWTREQAEAAGADGNNAAASKLNRDAASLANTIARIKADVAKSAGAGGIVFTAEQLQAARAALLERVNRLAASPEGSMGVCPRCGADIRMARASAPDAGKEV